MDNPLVLILSGVTCLILSYFITHLSLKQYIAVLLITFFTLASPQGNEKTLQSAKKHQRESMAPAFVLFLAGVMLILAGCFRLLA